MENDKTLYSYTGPVYKFDTLITDKWYGETYAVSKKKAKSNLIYQFKKTHGYEASSKFNIDEKRIVPIS